LQQLQFFNRLKTMKIIIAAFFLSISFTLSAQSTKDILLGGGIDLLKTDNNKLFQKVQLGFEGHYFLQRRFAVGLGAEHWSAQPVTSFMMGARWYPANDLFVRFRGLIGANDVSLGGGWSKHIKNNFRVEAMGDFYFGSTEFALRVGGAYVFKGK
jgi:hypothetical protein